MWIDLARAMFRPSVIAAALGLLADSAVAQSSATVFGIVDLNVATVKNDRRTWQVGSGGLSTSRLGFRGVEDLGGDLRAGFWLEAGLGPDTGTGSTTFGSGDPAQNPLLFRRRSTVSLSNRYGEIRLGRDLNPTYWTWDSYDPFIVTGFGSAQNIAVDGNLLAGTGGAYDTLLRTSNMVSYVLPGGPTGDGLTGMLSMAAGEGSAGNEYAGGRIGYAMNAWSVAAAYGVTGVTVGGDIKARVWNVGGAYDFGSVRLSAFFNRIDVTGGGFAGSGQDNAFIALVAPFGAWTLRASYGRASGSGTIEGSGATQWALGLLYSLSRRTTLYGVAAAIDNEPTSNYRITSQSSSLSPGVTSQGAQFGVRHTF